MYTLNIYLYIYIHVFDLTHCSVDASNLTSQGFSVNIILESFLVASMVAVCSGFKMTIFSKFNCMSQKRPVSSRMVFPLPCLKVSKQLPFTALIN